MKKIINLFGLSLVVVIISLITNNCEGGGDTKTPASIVYKGVTYKTIKSPVTGRIWLDRNIGAAEVCTEYVDKACYGDYFQWGRKADGHEDIFSRFTDKQATDIHNVGHSLFIRKNGRLHGDWAYNADPSGVKRMFNWLRTDGSYVCPKGFRVPTKEEIEKEIKKLNIKNKYDAFNSFLKLPSGGARDLLPVGHLFSEEEVGSIWLSTPTSYYAYGFLYNSKSAKVTELERAEGIPVRCIKEK